jgi:hypothetical protein
LCFEAKGSRGYLLVMVMSMAGMSFRSKITFDQKKTANRQSGLLALTTEITKTEINSAGCVAIRALSQNWGSS